ncbi:hypothetical protein RUM44_006703 [Polyplax serrata]|uniref:Receptor ligand binding region domain-containing protein n=1 Tax=Polyplax serrata TaxID=468196 RepID=A0ABR1AJ30_POLSC
MIREAAEAKPNHKMTFILKLNLILLFLVSAGDSHARNDWTRHRSQFNEKYLSEYLQRRHHRHKHGEYPPNEYPDARFYETQVRNLIADVLWANEKETEIYWPVKKEAVVEGDLILGGLMMVHEREDTVTCGPVMPQGGVQALETMLYTLDVINNSTLLPSIRLGAHILDDCDKDTYGLEMAVDFIKGTAP